MQRDIEREGVMMNPETNELEKLRAVEGVKAEDNEKLKEFFQNHDREEYHDDLIRPNGEPVPKKWAVFSIGDEFELKGHKFKVSKIGNNALVLRPSGEHVVRKREWRGKGVSKGASKKKRR